NNAALVLYGIFMTQLLEPSISGMIGSAGSDVISLVIQTVISTLIVLVTAEFLPKSIFLLNPEFFIKTFALPMLVIWTTLYLIVYMVLVLSKFLITRILGLEYSDEKPVFGLTDLSNYLKRSIVNSEENQMQEVDAKIFNNAVEFKTIKVRECMIPRTEIVGLDINDSISELKESLISTGFSKIIIYKETTDDVIGYCHSLELFKKPKDIKSILNPIIIVPETMPANELMIQFIAERKSIALVVDEYGGTSGIVTIEDIIEEIFGEIQDEHDDEYLTEERIDENNFVLSARHEIDYLNDKYEWQLPMGDYDTLGGLILEYNENIPSKNEVIEIENFIFTIITLEDNRIDRVKMTRLNSEDQKTE
ncbi:MAG: hemolysin family protein, partial [Cyclobacteriaceae bacterium]